MRRFSLLSILAVFWTANAYAFVLAGFDAPQAVAVDPDDGAYYVTNLDPAAGKGAHGYISRIGANGNIVIQKYIGGTENSEFLTAPKGIVVKGQRIYVADSDSVKVFDKESRSLVDSIQLPEARLLSGLALSPGGDLYVSDPVENRIFRIQTADRTVTLVKAGKELGRPNAILFNPKTRNLIVAGFESGSLIELDRMGTAHVLKKGLTALDGLTMDGRGNLYLSSFDQGEVYRVKRMGRGALSTYLSGLRTPAGLVFDVHRGELVIPSTQGRTITSVFQPDKTFLEK